MWGDLGAAAPIAERPGVTVQVSTVKFIRTDETVIFLKVRSRIGLVNDHAIKIGAV